MNELVSESGANLIAASLSVILLILGTAVGAAKGRLKAGILVGAGFAVLNLGLWWLYNAVVRATGLDSFWGLVGQVVLFAAIGAAIGGVVPLITKARKGGDGTTDKHR